MNHLEFTFEQPLWEQVLGSIPVGGELDAVRFLTNRSTGKMGYALAEAARDAGYDVTLVSGPVSLAPVDGVTMVMIESAADMADAVKSRAPEMDIVIMAAAVADYRPAQVHQGKMKKQPGNLMLELERTEDILASLGQVKPSGQILVGFAAETDDLLANAAGKLQRKNLDWIVANDVSRSDRGFGTSTNAVTMICRDGRRIDLPLAEKKDIARTILRTVDGR